MGGGVSLRKVAIGLSLVLVLLLSSCAGRPYREVSWRALSGLSSAAPVVLSPLEFVPEVEAIITAIDEQFALRSLKGITAAGLRERFLPRVRAANDMNELNPILLEMFASLQNGHANVFTMMPVFGAPIRATIVEGYLVVTRVDDPSLIAQGVSKGWIVQQVDGMPTLDWLQEHTKYVSASTPDARLRGSADITFVRFEFEPELRSYKFVSPTGDVLGADISLTISGSDLPRLVQHPVEVRAFGDIGYIAINTMTDGIVERFDRALRTMRNKAGLVIDLRQNGGGNSLNGNKMLRRLIQSPTRSWSRRTEVPYSALNYAGPIVVLVGSRTASAAESFAFDLFDSGRVTVIGEPTFGCSGGGPKLFATRGGILFRLPTRGVDMSVSGLPMFGVGLQPHIHIAPTRQDIITGADPALLAAVQHLRALEEKTKGRVLRNRLSASKTTTACSSGRSLMPFPSLLFPSQTGLLMPANTCQSPVGHCTVLGGNIDADEVYSLITSSHGGCS